MIDKHLNQKEQITVPEAPSSEAPITGRKIIRLRSTVDHSKTSTPECHEAKPIFSFGNAKLNTGVEGREPSAPCAAEVKQGEALPKQKEESGHGHDEVVVSTEAHDSALSAAMPGSETDAIQKDAVEEQETTPRKLTLEEPVAETKGLQDPNADGSLSKIEPISSPDVKEAAASSGASKATVSQTVTDNASQNIAQHQGTEQPLPKTPADAREGLSSGNEQTTPDKGIFGNFFSKPFTNPFSEAAKSGEANFAVSARPESFTTPVSTVASTDHEDGESPQCDDSSGTQTSGGRPLQFPGEEEDTEEFSELGPADPPSTSTPDTSKTVMKFRKLGEGPLRILRSPKNDCRLIVRQKGTWSLLLNSPLWLSSRFDPGATGCHVKFVGVDMQQTNADATKVAAYCVKFDNEAKRSLFLEVVKTAQKTSETQASVTTTSPSNS